MSSFPKSAFCLLGFLLLAGCTQMVWVKPGATQSEFEQTKAACMMEAAKQVPQDNRTVLISQGRMTSTYQCKDKGNKSTCFETRGYAPPEYGVVDNNEGLRNQVYRACLFRNGWNEVEKKD